MWNYRLIQKRHSGVAWLNIHEVFYDEDGSPVAATELPVSPHAETAEEMAVVLDQMRIAITKPIIDDPRVWSPPKEWGMYDEEEK